MSKGYFEQSPFMIAQDSVIVRRSKLDGSMPKVVPPPLRQPILDIAHNSTIAGHLC